MWELDCEESWALKNWCFWTVLLKKTLESPLDCKEIQPVYSEGDQPWDLFRSYDAKAETSVIWPPHEKSWLIGKDSDAGRDWGQEEKGTTEDEMAGWHHWLDGCESEWTPGVGDRQGGLACCDSWGLVGHDWATELYWTEWFVSELIWTEYFKYFNKLKVKVDQSCLTFLHPHRLYSPWYSPYKNTGVDKLSLPEDLPNPGIKPRHPAMQMYSLPAKPQENPKNTWLVILPLLHWTFLTQE